MSDVMRVVVMGFGAFVALVGIALFTWKRTEGQNTAKMFGIEITVSTPSLMIFAAGCAIFVAPFFVPQGDLEPNSQTSTTRIKDSPAPSPSPRLAKPHMLNQTLISVDASSELEPAGANEYFATNLLDGDPTTAWVEGVAGSGVGETLTFRFPRRVNLDRVQLVNGYAKSEDLFLSNGRIKQMVVQTDVDSFSLLLRDTKDPQSLRRRFGKTSSLTMTIESVYPGRRYEDTALTSIAFWAS
jgi:hypothetical protein